MCITNYWLTQFILRSRVHFNGLRVHPKFQEQYTHNSKRAQRIFCSADKIKPKYRTTTISARHYTIKLPTSSVQFNTYPAASSEVLYPFHNLMQSDWFNAQLQAPWGTERYKHPMFSNIYQILCWHDNSTACQTTFWIPSHVPLFFNLASRPKNNTMILNYKIGLKQATKDKQPVTFATNFSSVACNRVNQLIFINKLLTPATFRAP